MVSGVRNTIRFLLNGALISLTDVPATQTLLDYLRLDKNLRGTKEGCAEGDCGACTVLVGRLSQGALVYEAVNACIRFVGSLDACHVVTIEHLKTKTGSLHPVQQAMLEHHGSQCGFCTPGIVMSLYGLWMGTPKPSVSEIEEALQGNLCRCTGYAPIVRAAQAVVANGDLEKDHLVAERAEISARLKELQDGCRVETGSGHDQMIVPANVDDLADILEATPDATLIAGSTDVGLWVTKLMREIAPVVFVGNLEGLQAIVEEEAGLTIGAGVTYTNAFGSIAKHFPHLTNFWKRIGGAQVRNMGTIGGNIANGSPIGDTPPALIALGATITLRKGKQRRVISLENYFVAYGSQDRAPGEFVESIHIPWLNDSDQHAVYKISKRRDEDISALCAAIKIHVADGAVDQAVVAFGGMAATPKRATKTEQALVGAAWDQNTIEAAVRALAEDFQPISDMRASAEYRMLAAQNLLRRFYLEASGETAQLTREVV